MHLKLVSHRQKKPIRQTIAKTVPTILASINQAGGANVYKGRKLVKKFLFDFNAIKFVRKLSIEEHNNAVMAIGLKAKKAAKGKSIDQILPVH